MTQREGPERDFEARLRSRLAAQVESVDEVTRARLRSVRHTALEQLEMPRSVVPRWLPAGALAASLALLAVLVVLRNDEQPLGEATGADLIADSSQTDDLELLVADEDLELLEDLEFYQWLQPNGDSG